MSQALKIMQMTPNYSYGDAIGNFITEIDQLLKEDGHQTTIYADWIHPKVTGKPYEEYLADVTDDSWLIYHYSTGSPVNQFVLDHGKNVILIYHNITPPSFFAPYDPVSAANCRLGRELLPAFASNVALAVGVSAYNARELTSLGFEDPVVSPLIMDISHEGKTATVSPFHDHKVNILFVGRVAPNKKHENLIKTFYFFKNYVNPHSRLTLVGGYHERGAYYTSLAGLIQRLDLSDVTFTGPVTDGELYAHFNAADLYLSLSEHEGFCVPLIEAMSHDLPVIALAAAAAPETMGPAGVLVERFDPASVAELIGLVTEDQTLRDTIIATQKERLKTFSRKTAIASFRAMLQTAFSRVPA